MILTLFFATPFAFTVAGANFRGAKTAPLAAKKRVKNYELPEGFGHHHTTPAHV